MAAVDTNADPARVLQVALAEFSALRGEIKDRSASAWTMVSLNITATSAVLGFVLSKGADPLLLLALPIVAPSLGMLFIDHAYNINNLGSYIGARIRPLIVGASGEPSLLGYEDAMDTYEQRRLLRFLPFGLPLTLLFSGIPIGCLVFVVPSLHASWSWLLWAFGIGLVTTQLVLWLLFLLRPRLFDAYAR